MKSLEIPLIDALPERLVTPERYGAVALREVQHTLALLPDEAVTGYPEILDILGARHIREWEDSAT